MRKLKNVSIVVIMFIMAAEAHAQIVGVRAGLNLSTMLIKDDDETFSDDFEMKPGFHVGPTAEFPISDMLSFETAFMISTKGYKFSDEDVILGQTVKVKNTINLIYLDIPITLKGAAEVGNAKIYGTFGPYIGIGLGGKDKFEMSVGDETDTDEESIEWGSDEDNSDFKRLDFGLSVGAGVEISSVQIGLSYGLGLANISPDTDNGMKINNRVIGISVGFKFGGN